MEVARSYKIAFKGLKHGHHDFGFEVGDDFFATWEGSEIDRGNCRVHVELERSETQLALGITIEGEIVVPCDRCLEPCVIPVDYEGELLVKFSDEVSEYDGEVMWIPAAEDEVDLAQYIYESIVLSLPYQRVHAEGGCDPEMMRQFSIVTDAEFALLEERAEAQAGGSMAQSELEKLAALKAAMEREE